MEFTSDGDTLYSWFSEARAAGGRPADSSRALPLVLLHPTPLDHRFWAPVLAAVGNYRLLVPDLRGHGRSPLGSAVAAESNPVLTIRQLARDAVALLDAFAIEQAIFIGCSIGGYTLYELWRTAPERIAGLVFCASKPQADTDAERAKREDWIALHEPLRLSGGQSPAPAFVEAMLAALLSGETWQEQPQLVAEVRAMMQQVTPEAVQAIQRGLGSRPDSRPSSAAITVPSCVIAGEQDSSSTPAAMLALHNLLKQGGARAEYHVISRAGHYAPMEQPDAVGTIIGDFCNSIQGSSPRL